MKFKAAFAALLLGAAVSFSSLPASAADASGPTAEECLQCHGPYDKLRESTKNWKDEFGDQIQPHQYMDPDNALPHQGKKLAPDCKSCHGVHPIPPKPGFKMKEPSFSSCYGCHHMENFQKCGSSGCHEGETPKKKS